MNLQYRFTGPLGAQGESGRKRERETKLSLKKKALYDVLKNTNKIFPKSELYIDIWPFWDSNS